MGLRLLRHRESHPIEDNPCDHAHVIFLTAIEEDLLQLGGRSVAEGIYDLIFQYTDRIRAETINHIKEA